MNCRGLGQIFLDIYCFNLDCKVNDSIQNYVVYIYVIICGRVVFKDGIGFWGEGRGYQLWGREGCRGQEQNEEGVV